MKPLADYLSFCAVWLAMCLLGASLGHSLPAAFVLWPLWIPFAVGGLLLAFLCLASLVLIGAAWAMSVAVEWGISRKPKDEAIGEIDYDAMPESVRGMREDCEMDAVAAKALIPSMCHGLIRDIDTQGGSAVAKLALPPEWIDSTRRDMEYAGWQWLGQEWTPRAPNVYMVEFRYVGSEQT